MTENLKMIQNLNTNCIKKNFLDKLKKYQQEYLYLLLWPLFALILFSFVFVCFKEIAMETKLAMFLCACFFLLRYYSD